MSMRNSILAALIWAHIPSIAQNKAPEAREEQPENRTIIEGQIEHNNDGKFNYYPDKNSLPLNDASMLFHIPGLTLTEKGGALGTSEIRFHGLSGSRLRVDLEGLNLNNPINGLNDANAMFLFAASRMQTNAQSLLISLPYFTDPHAKGLFGFGTQNSLKIGGSVGAPLGEHSSIFMAMQLSSTGGNFAFSSPYLDKKDPNNHFHRQNNDQHRLQTLVKYQRKAPSSGAHALLAFNAHEGGIAGYASSPSLNLRSKSLYSGLSLGASKKLDQAELYANVATGFFNYQTSDIPANNEEFTSTTHEISLGIRPIKFFKAMDFDLAQQIVIERAYEINQTRIGGGFFMKRVNYLQGRMKPVVFANFSMLGFQSFGLIFKKDLGITIEPRENTSVTARFVRSQRLPTFMEMYANNRFFVGNTDLKKESVWDIELSSTYRFGNKAQIKILGFFGFLSDVIVYVPLLGTKQMPINVDVARRYGLDLSFSYAPFDWLFFETNNSLLYTNIKATEAPLPQAPPFIGFSKLRIGPDDFINLSLLSRYRASATANMNGTLKTKGYGLLDAVLSVRFLKHITTSFSVNNIFNTKTARDSYEMPLPGTTFFAQIEVENN